MPADSRRFNGPEDSVPYQFYTKNYARRYEELSKQLLNDEDKRKDGRSLVESGVTRVHVNVITEAKGSSYLETRDTKIMCSVFDPREIPHQNEFSQLGKLYCEVRFAPFSCSGKRRPLAPEDDERDLSEALKQALEPAVCRQNFANYQVDVFVYILENDGACLAAAINAAGVALINAAIPMFDVITASTVAVSDTRFFADPTANEEFVALNECGSSNHGVITMSKLPEMNQVTYFNVVGSLNVPSVNQAIEILESECGKMLPVLSKCIFKHLKDDSHKNKSDAIQRRANIINMKLAEWSAAMT